MINTEVICELCVLYNNKAVIYKTVSHILILQTLGKTRMHGYLIEGGSSIFEVQ